MTSLLSDPWIEERVVSALLYHRQKKPQDRKSQVAQVISVGRNNNAAVLSDGKHYVKTCYENLNGTLQKEKLVRLNDWTITTAGTLGASQNKDAICFYVAALEVIGGQGMGIVGEPSPIDEAIEVRRVLDSWKWTSTSELLDHSKPPMGDVAKLLQDTRSHFRLLQQYDIHREHQMRDLTPRTTGNSLSDGALANNGPHPGTPVSRKRPPPESKSCNNESPRKSPHLHSKTSQVQEYKQNAEINMSDDSDEDHKQMSISNMLIADGEELDEESTVETTAATVKQQDKSQHTGNEETTGTEETTERNPLLTLWWKLTKQPPKPVERDSQTERLIMKKWRELSKQDNVPSSRQ